MIRLADCLAPKRVGCRVNASDKGTILEMLATLISGEGPEAVRAEVLGSLAARERLGSTALGHGVAIPHARQGTGGMPRAAVLCTAEAIDFDAIDGRPVDLFLALLISDDSNEEHLNLLAQLAEMFSDKQLVAALRACHSGNESYDLLTGWRPQRPPDDLRHD